MLINLSAYTMKGIFSNSCDKLILNPSQSDDCANFFLNRPQSIHLISYLLQDIFAYKSEPYQQEFLLQQYELEEIDLSKEDKILPVKKSVIKFTHF